MHSIRLSFYESKETRKNSIEYRKQNIQTLNAGVTNFDAGVTFWLTEPMEYIKNE